MKTLREYGSMLIFKLVLSLLFPFISLAIDTITPATPLTVNQTLVSNGGAFELGFFSTNNNDLYIGIWYKQIEERTYVWVANRDNPITSSSGKLTIGENGKIILVDQSETEVWSLNESVPVVNTVAQLLDNGNFVLRPENDENPDNYIWQSFDYPRDTLLPEMKLGWSRKTGNTWFLTSWKNSTDPGSGDYSFRMDIHGFPELVIWNNDTKISRSGPWTGQQFSGTPDMKGANIMNFSFLDNSDDIYYSYYMLNKSVYSRVLISPSGFLERYIWVETTNSWSLFYTYPSDTCDNYGKCGQFGICDANITPNCKCITGFRPKDQQAWDYRDGSGGCVRTSKLDCNTDGFLRMKNMRLPDGSKAFTNQNMNLSDCAEMCKKNCSCAAYANMDVTGGGSGCAIWEVDLMDMREYADSEGGGQDLYVRVAASDIVQSLSRSSKNSSGNNNHVVTIIAFTVGGVSAVLVVLFMLFYLKRRKIQRLKRSNSDEQDPQDRSASLLLNDIILLNKRDYYGETKMDELELPLFNFTTLAMATNNFSDANKLGHGGFGSVYKGVLTEGEVVAIKRLSRVSDQGIEELKNEVQLIAKLQHRNLVRVLGCCIEVEEKLLIYEFMENKSLDTFLFEKEMNEKKLSWPIRFDIICGIARGLLYLHQDSRFKIIHRDLKASNILLDNEMNPKISDFGMARIFGRDQTEAETKKVVGTYGYMSPEYAMDGSYSTKSDVFSFGVLVLEIVSGQKNRGSSYTSSQLNLLGHTWMLWKEGNPFDLLDESLKDKFSEDEVLRCIQIGLLCVQEQPEDRPSMSKVLLMLSSETIQLSLPNYPGFFIGKKETETDLSSLKYDSVTVNEITVTALDPR